MQLQGKTAIVTEAASGIGKEVARRFLCEFARELPALEVVSPHSLSQTSRLVSARSFTTSSMIQYAKNAIAAR
jgi:NAD(P)-dependent dehydrogenase (short-subunit alcohol dehydrogenase family)